MGRWTCAPQSHRTRAVGVEAGAMPERIVGLVVAAALAGALALCLLATFVVAALVR